MKVEAAISPQPPMRTTLSDQDFICYMHCKLPSRIVTSKTMLRWGRLCDNSLHRRAPCFTRVVSLKLVAGCDKCHDNSGDYVENYTRAFGDGPRNFEPWSSDVDDT
ncbi:hypothetical protein TNCV_293901 [Trichonephila clavipes]|nr:hypothetical protein TNCV_293901 [Trichonephila clavipes]